MTTDAKRPIYPQSFDASSFYQLVHLLRLRDQATPLTPASTGWTTANYTPTRTLDASTATVGDVADVLATLIEDLKTAGFLA